MSGFEKPSQNNLVEKIKPKLNEMIKFWETNSYVLSPITGHLYSYLTQLKTSFQSDDKPDMLIVGTLREKIKTVFTDLNTTISSLMVNFAGDDSVIPNLEKDKTGTYLKAKTELESLDAMLRQLEDLYR
jgi:hypothetical protein